jgi:hypothetical protein
MHLSSLPSFLDWHWLWFTVASFLAGVLNAVAGGGSFLSFPAMLSMRILPVQANATNTVALWPGQLTSVAAYRDDIRKNLRLALPMGVAGLIGGTVGALVLLNTPQMTFLHLVPWLLLISSSIFAFTGPVSRWLARRKGGHAAAHQPRRRLPVFLATMAVCFYIGYFGAGAGFLLITVLSLFGLSGPARDQCPQGGLHHTGQRHRCGYLCRERQGGLALLPAGHVRLCHRRIFFSTPGSPRPAARASRAGHLYRPLHGRMVLYQ